MKYIIVSVTTMVFSIGCSSLDFFQYRENTGLYAVEKPSGYGSISFGARLTASGTADEDYMAISGGNGTQVAIFRLTESQEIADIGGPWRRYPNEALDIAQSGAALQGLPMFYHRGKPVEGRFAVGEPERKRVSIYDPVESKATHIEKPGIPGFGRVLSALPARSAPWLLVAGGDNAFQLFSDAVDETARSQPVTGIDSGFKLTALTAGRFSGGPGASERLFVAAGTANAKSGQHRVHVYVTDASDRRRFAKAICLEDDGDISFGTGMTAGDLDGDGADELIVGAPDSRRVYIFDAASIAATQAIEGCTPVGAQVSPMLTLSPEEGEPAVACDETCGFGSALVVGDIATDDDGPELVVGAPDASVDGTASAGAVYIFRDWTRIEDERGADAMEGGGLAGQVFAASPKEDGRLGAALAVAPVAGRNELLVGLPGAGVVYVAFCTGVGEDIESGADTPRSGEGALISTRCRL